MHSESPPNTRDVIVSLGVTFAALILVSFGGLIALGMFYGEEIPDTVVSATLLVLTPTTIGVCAIGFARSHSADAPGFLGAGMGRLWWLFPGVVCAGVLSEGLYVLIQQHASDLDGGAVDQLGEAVQQGGVAGAFILLGALVLAPLGEELFFRGWIFRSVEQQAGSGLAILISALAFAGYHMDWAHTLAILPLAIWISWLRAVTGAVGACVLAHVLNNALWVFSTRTSAEGWDFFPWLGPISVVGLAGMLLFVQHRGRLEAKEH